jgi:hypothetical protein
MKEMSDWLETQNTANLARFAKRATRDLEQVIVTRAMTEAAMEYVYSLYEPSISTDLLEEVFRIMAALQPRGLEA